MQKLRFEVCGDHIAWISKFSTDGELYQEGIKINIQKKLFKMLSFHDYFIKKVLRICQKLFIF